MSDTNNTNIRPTLTPQLVEQLVDAVRNINKLQSQNIVTATRDTQLAAYVSFVASHLPTYADELLGCWLFANREFPKLIQAFRIMGSFSGFVMANQIQPELKLEDSNA